MQIRVIGCARPHTHARTAAINTNSALTLLNQPRSNFCRTWRLYNFSFSSLLTHHHSVASATVHGGEDLGGAQACAEGPGTGLRWKLSGVPLLPLPTHCGLWRLWLGLDYSPKAIQGQLLLWGVWVHAPPEISAYPPGQQGQPQRNGGPLLYPHQVVAHQHALL